MSRKKRKQEKKRKEKKQDEQREKQGISDEELVKRYEVMIDHARVSWHAETANLTQHLSHTRIQLTVVLAATGFFAPGFIEAIMDIPPDLAGLLSNGYFALLGFHSIGSILCLSSAYCIIKSTLLLLGIGISKAEEGGSRDGLYSEFFASAALRQSFADIEKVMSSTNLHTLWSILSATASAANDLHLRNTRRRLTLNRSLGLLLLSFMLGYAGTAVCKTALMVNRLRAMEAAVTKRAMPSPPAQAEMSNNHNSKERQ